LTYGRHVFGISVNVNENKGKCQKDVKNNRDKFSIMQDRLAHRRMDLLKKLSQNVPY
jgi:hypothetical protein